MILRLATAAEPLSGPARVCDFCEHAAHLHREERENGEGFVHGATSCIGPGPGYACDCARTCQDVNSRNLVVDDMPKLQLVVSHKGNVTGYYPVSLEEGGWKVDTDTRQIVIGRGVPRTFIPLDNVLSYAIEEWS